jgi:hypothetical protein
MRRSDLQSDGKSNPREEGRGKRRNAGKKDFHFRDRLCIELEKLLSSSLTFFFSVSGKRNKLKIGIGHSAFLGFAPPPSTFHHNK